QVYGGTRSLFNPLTFAVVGVDRKQGGASARVTLPASFGSTLDNRVSAGVDGQWLNDARKNWANCNGLTKTSATCPSITVEKGNVSLDQRELVSSIGPYVRDELDVGNLRTTAGI